MLGTLVTKPYKLLFLSGLKWDAEDATLALFATLKAAARAQLTEVKGGKVLTSTASNGFAGTFSLPLNGQGITPLAAAELCGELLSTYSSAKAALIARGTAAPTDEEIYDEMVLLIEQGSATESYNDFSCIRR